MSKDLCRVCQVSEAVTSRSGFTDMLWGLGVLFFGLGVLIHGC